MGGFCLTLPSITTMPMTTDDATQILGMMWRRIQVFGQGHEKDNSINGKAYEAAVCHSLPWFVVPCHFQ